MSSMSATGAAGASQGLREAQGLRKMQDEVLGALADKFGMTRDDLQAKLSSADDPRKALDQIAEEKGVSGQELRATIHAAMPQRAEGGRSGHGGPPPPPSPSGSGTGVSFDDEVGQKLLTSLARTMDLWAEELKAQLDSGTDLRTVLDSHNVSHEQVRAAFQEASKSWQSYSAAGSSSDAYTPEYNAVDVQL